MSRRITHRCAKPAARSAGNKKARESFAQADVNKMSKSWP
jgi:hypothetical protein